MTTALPLTTYDPDEVAAMFGMSVTWVRRGVQRRNWPHLRLGGPRSPIRFTEDHIKAIAAMHEHQPRAATAPQPRHAGTAAEVFGATRRSVARKRK